MSMRRRDREVSGIDGIEEILLLCKTCHVAMIDGGAPYIVPLSYGYSILEGNVLELYFHSAPSGRKLDILRRSNKVCFEMAYEGEPVHTESPCNSGYYYSSVIGSGSVEFIDDPYEKCRALSVMFRHQSGKDVIFTAEQADSVCVFKIISADFTGKKKNHPEINAESIPARTALNEEAGKDRTGKAPDNAVILETTRLILRPFAPGDFEAAQSWAGNPANTRYMAWGPNSEEQTREFLASAKPGRDFAVVLKESGSVIGSCGVYPDSSGYFGNLGWILHMDYWQKGYGTELAGELIRYGFEDLKLQRLQAPCAAVNYGSYRVMERNGMRREALHVKAFWARVDKEWIDEAWYAILAEEYFSEA